MFEKYIFLVTYAEFEGQTVYDYIKVDSLNDATSMADFLDGYFGVKCMVAVGEKIEESEAVYLTGNNDENV